MTGSASEVVGPYRLERQLGEGGMGTVWSAVHAESGVWVALKLMKTASPSAEERRRLLREARVASAIQHPNVVRVFDVFETEQGTPVIVMELLQGETLRGKLIREVRLEPSETANVVLPVISAVGTAHALGIVHRDLKPENVFLALENRATRSCVLDFGTAKLTASVGLVASAQLTQPGALVGTVLYMAPEQITGEPVDHRTDIWALGVILYEALSGARPIDGTRPEQVVMRLVSSAITPLSVVAPDVPEDLAELVRRMLTRDRSERPSDLREVYAVLEAHAHVPSLRFSGPRTSALSGT
jgi:eukaryotic-like serine/threonine-protein kinase